MSQLSEEGKAILRFVREQVEAQLATLTAARTIVPEVHIDTHPTAPAVQVENKVDVPAPIVNVAVDMAPVADAIRAMGELFADAIERLSQMMADRPAPEIVLPPPVEMPARQIKIDHSDGTSSTVSEV